MPERFERRLPAAVIALICLIYIASSAVEIIYPNSLRSTDGAFQTLSAVMRYSAGQVPVRDFYPYLGIGVSASLVPGYVLTGKQLLLSSNLSVALVLLVANFVGMGSLFRINGFGRRACLLATLVVFNLLAYSAFDPGYSLRPLRGALPLIVAALLHLPRCRWPSARPSLSTALLFGLCLSIAPLWSNDLGPPTTMAFILAWLIYAPDWRKFAVRNLGNLAAMLAVVFAINGVLIVWMGGIAKFLQMQAGFSRDQFWYFNPWGERVQVFSIADVRYIFAPLFTRASLAYGAVPIALAILAALPAWRRLRGKQLAGDATVFAIALASCGGVLLPQLGGHIEWGYELYAANVVIALIIIEASKRPHLAAGTRTALDRQTSALGPANMRVRDLVLICLALVMSFVFVRGAVVAVKRYPPIGREAIETRRVLGVYSRNEAGDVACFARAGALFDTYGVAPDKRMLSTYLSAIHLAAGAEQPMKVDSVIHLLGDQFRAENLAMIARSKPVLVSLVGADYNPWDRWNVRNSWGVFEPVFQHYEPLLRTYQHLVMMRMPDDKAEARNRSVGAGQALPCTLQREGSDHTMVRIDGGGVTASVWAQVTVDQATNRTGKGLLAPFRALLMVEERPDRVPFFELPTVKTDPAVFVWHMQRYGADMSRRQLVVPFDMEPREESRLNLQLAPAHGWQLDVRSCRARIAAPQIMDQLESMPPLGNCAGFLQTLSSRLEELGYRRRRQ